MTLLNTADAIYRGSAAADKVFLGTVQVWPPVLAWAKSALVMGFGPVVVSPGASRQANINGVMVNI